MAKSRKIAMADEKTKRVAVDPNVISFENDDETRRYETLTPDGQKIIMVDGPSEIVSWVFPHESEEDDKRIALVAEIDKLIDNRIAEALAFK
jgi:hypothetical protein